MGVKHATRFTSRYTELWQGSIEAGKCAALSRATRVRTIGEEGTKDTSTAYRAVSSSEEDTFKALMELRTLLSEQARGKEGLTILYDGIPAQVDLKKMVTCVLGPLEIGITIYQPPEQKSKRRFTNDAVIIGQEDKSYADILRAVKEEMAGSEEISKINTARKTRRGEVLLELGKGFRLGEAH